MLLILKAAFLLSVKICVICGKRRFVEDKTNCFNSDNQWQTSLNFTLCSSTKLLMQN